MNPVPLSWMIGGFATLMLAVAGVGKYALHLNQQLGAARAECNASVIEGAANQTTTTLRAENQALKDQVTQLAAQKAVEQRLAQEAQDRAAASSALAGKYRKQLNEARKADPGLDRPLDAAARQRLRQYEDDYRAGAGGGPAVPVRPGP